MRSAWLGTISYETALALQEQLVRAKLTNPHEGLPEPEDTLLLLEHAPVYTYHNDQDFETCLREPKENFLKSARVENIKVLHTSRGGKMTYHGPGQLVGYFISRLPGPFAHDFMGKLASAIISTLDAYGITPEYRDGGLWVGSKKICSFGVQFVHSRITMHGFALNVTEEPIPYFRKIYPCGIEGNDVITSLSQYIGPTVTVESVARKVGQHFGAAFREPLRETTPDEFGYYPLGKPRWIRAVSPIGPIVQKTRELVRDAKLHTVCEEARCPNLGECWARGDVTIMILGDTCTRSCGFCAVKTGRPPVLDWNEPLRTAQAVAKIPHSHIVITSVDRDELPDNGSRVWAATIEMVKRFSPEKTIEVLTPDFKGNEDHINFVLDAKPHVFAHNIETVKRLHKKVRPQAKYDRSLEVLALAQSHWLQPVVKSNIMLGFGESEGEVLETVRDLHEVGIDILTITQYLQPSTHHLPVIRYYNLDEFNLLKSKAEAIGIPVVISGPLVRTSYKAGEAYALVKGRSGKRSFRETLATTHAV